MNDFSWANWSTISKDGVVTLWQNKPLFILGKWIGSESDERIESLSSHRVEKPKLSAATLKRINYYPMELSNESIINIFGEFEYEEITNGDKILAIWNSLKHAKIKSSGHSLHVIEVVYELENVNYRCLWSISDNNSVPFEISIQTKRKNIHPEQLELF